MGGDSPTLPLRGLWPLSTVVPSASAIGLNRAYYAYAVNCEVEQNVLEYVVRRSNVGIKKFIVGTCIATSLNILIF